MTLDIYQIDAFANRLFEGNPAAVCPLDDWLPDQQLQKIAMENNLSETAFWVKEKEGFRLRWFTPEAEVDLCGHATLATAHLLFTHSGYDQTHIKFITNSGTLEVRKNSDGYSMNFPAKPYPKEAPPLNLYHALGGFIADEVYKNDDYLWVFNKEEKIRNISPDFSALAEVNMRGVIVTAPAEDEETDFVSRYFAPSIGVNEDPVTGPTHCMLIPYWAERLDKKQLIANQISQRGGRLKCRLLDEDRVEITGQAKTYLKGKIEIDM